jgi:hypothetical protein
MVDDEERLAALRARMTELCTQRERCRARATQYRQEAQSLARRLSAQPSASAIDGAKERLASQERHFEVAGGAKQVWFRVSEPDTHGEKTLTIRVTTDLDGSPEVRELTIPQRVWPFVRRFCDAAQQTDGEDVVANRTPSPAARPAEPASHQLPREDNSAQRGESTATVAASPTPLRQTSARSSTQQQHVDAGKTRHATTQRAQRRPPQAQVPQVAVGGTPENNAGAVKVRQRGPSRQPTHGPQTRAPSQKQQRQQQQQPKTKASGRPEAPQQQQTSARKGRRRGSSSTSGAVDDSQRTTCVISVRGGNVKISTSESA